MRKKEKGISLDLSIIANIKYENLIWKTSEGILLYFLIAQTVFTKILPFSKQKMKLGRLKKELISQYF